jgi:hypothetical protein
MGTLKVNGRAFRTVPIDDLLLEVHQPASIGVPLFPAIQHLLDCGK